MFAVLLKNKHKEAQIKLYNNSNIGFADFPVLSVSESSIFGHQMLICQTCCVSPTVLLCSPFADIMVTEAIRSAGKSHQEPHVNLSAPITG